MLKLLYSKKSKSDLIYLFENIKEDKPNAAKEYTKKLKEYIELLITNPNMGTDCKNKSLKIKCKILIFRSHLIFYRLRDTKITIIRVKNSKENYNTKL